MDPIQWVEKGNSLKIEGNEFFKTQNYETAIEKYEEALDFIDWEVLDGVIQMKVDLNNNIALCFIKIQKYKTALRFCNRALEMDKTNIKSLLWKSKALCELQKYEDSLDILKKALEIYPEDKELKFEFNRVKL